MRALLQRVLRANVTVDGQVVGAIDAGWLVFLGIGRSDQQAQADRLADRIVHLRAFDDASRRMNLSVHDVGGSVLVVPQFTLYADTTAGRRPSFIAAAHPDVAEPLVDHFVSALNSRGIPIATGTFGAHMTVDLVNDGPVTFLLEA
ncbi:MAG: dtd [Chloroflexi bacterium]|nr:dtd [Chloroflexota bacterium]